MNKNLLYRLLTGLVFIVQLSSCTTLVATKNRGFSGYINADDPNIQYVGRFDFSNPQQVSFDWPGVYIHAKFEGTSCSIRLNDHKNEYAVIVDSRAPRILTTDSSTVYRVAAGLADSIPHNITIIKRSEALFGKGEFLGFILDEGRKLLSPGDRPERRIEFIGNSITCGFGIEGENDSCNFSLQTENADMSYASMTARALNADYSLVAYSGRGAVRNYGDSSKTSKDPMPVLYERICFNDTTSKWNFSKWIPQAVVINLGTNDFSTKPYPDKEVFQNAYIQLINRIRAQYPGVTIFCICGPMTGEPCMGYIKEVVVNEQKKTRDKDVFFIPIPRSIMTDADWGCAMHPNISGAVKMMNEIVAVIKTYMNW
ncbi:MAG: SGNH/GDSL hydrolase family protein [Ignavibacteriaceae bacterium]|jgi:lysophospholipase L1-like esterase